MVNQPPQPDDGERSGLSDWTASRDLEETERADSGQGFTPGTMLAGRYRIVALLGQGGMGQVYRAEDTKLGQAVALKFVRGTLSPERRQRLYSEVRIGREVSHPSVCRLYDVVEYEGHTFITMEYVDGEDLASLLSRIGHLPPDKALDVARDLAAGLAAVHEKGVVHRDLKPANVMIDGRGRARLTDFGLAVAAEGSGAEAFAGTPAYMSPEQLSGGEITPRSDLYGLGLVIYEMFTGRPFFEARSINALLAQHREPKRPRLASASGRLDPVVERAVLQCLEEAPEARPVSARVVAASLPGGDPLEMAVLAGETPSPDLVAAARTVGDLTPLVAWAGLAVTIVALVLAAFFAHRQSLLGTLQRPPAALVERARDLLASLDQDAGVDSAWSFVRDRSYLDEVRRDDSPDRWLRIREGPFSPYLFVYRESPSRLVAANNDAMVQPEDPPLQLSGMTEVVLSPGGRLVRFVAVPPQLETGTGPWETPSWAPLFEEAGLDSSRLRRVTPRWAAPVDSDHKAAWEGSHPDAPGLPIRVEAAAYHGRPVWFAVLQSWTEPRRMVASTRLRETAPVGEAAVLLLVLALPLGAAFLARRNLRLGRSDRSGAVRVALFVFATYSVARLFRASHVSTFADEIWILIRVFSPPALWAMAVWLVYIALEPYARRRWPHMLISWKRLLGGSFRDPLVGRDFLLGAAVGSILGLLSHVVLRVPAWFGQPALYPHPWLKGSTLASITDVGFRLFVDGFSSVLWAMIYLFTLVLLRLLLRRNLLAAGVWCVLWAFPGMTEGFVFLWIGGLVRTVLMFLVLTRGGLLALVVTVYFWFILLEAPLTLDTSAWFATRLILLAVVLLGLTVYAFYTSLGGKPLLGRSLLEED
jgi:serine/threonine-protein kinase